MKIFTYLRQTIILSIAMLSFHGLNAQVTINVPADLPTVMAAIQSISTNPAVVNDTEVIINVTESVIETITAHVVISWSIQNLTITIQGQGPQTVVRSPLETRPALDGSDGSAFIQIGNTGSAMDGFKLNVKNITFKNWGTSKSDIQWGLFNFWVPLAAPWNGVITFENAIFDSCVGRTLFKAFQQQTHDAAFVFKNCHFVNCVATTLGTTSSNQGLISRERGGKLTVENCTFMNNTINEIREVGQVNGGLITYNPGVAGANDVVITGNEMYNNKFIPTADDSIQPLISIKPATFMVNLTLNNNVIIGNAREGFANDVDLVVYAPANITLSADGNVMNKAVQQVNLEGVISYVPYEISNSQVDAGLTYTSPAVNLVVADGLPVLENDEFGIPHGKKAPVNVLQSSGSNAVKAWPNPSTGRFEIAFPDAAATANFKVFSIVGKEILSGRFTDNNFVIDLSGEKKGVYVLQMESSGKVMTTKLVIK
jgi:hypothetical protein